MSELLPIVLDASVVLKWYLPGEDGTPEAVAFQDEFLANTIEIIMPDVARYEVANAINVARRRRRISADEARQAITDFLAWDFTYVATNDLILAGLDTALRLDCAVYDALYLTLAESVGANLVTADQALLTKTQPVSPWIKSLSEYGR